MFLLCGNAGCLEASGSQAGLFQSFAGHRLAVRLCGAVSSGRISGIACSQAQSEPGHAYCGTKGGVQRDADGGGMRRFSVPGTGTGRCAGRSVAYGWRSAGTGTPHRAAVRFGYAEVTAKGDSLLFRAGESAPVHEFHYWDSTQNGTDFTIRKPLGSRQWQEGFASPH